jgi:hypothetical protein
MPMKYVEGLGIVFSEDIKDVAELDMSQLSGTAVPRRSALAGVTNGGANFSSSVRAVSVVHSATRGTVFLGAQCRYVPRGLCRSRELHIHAAIPCCVCRALKPVVLTHAYPCGLLPLIRFSAMATAT